MSIYFKNYLVLFVKTFKQILRLLWRLNQFCQFYWLVLCDNTEDVIFLAAWQPLWTRGAQMCERLIFLACLIRALHQVLINV